MPQVSQKLFAQTILALLFLGACAPEKQVPEAPEDPAAQGTAAAASASQRNSQDETAAEGKGQYAGWGAHAGTTDILARLAKCNEGGHFFDRSAEEGKGACDSARKILGNCNSFEAVEKATKISEAQRGEIQGLFTEGGDLEGFLFDQCVESVNSSGDPIIEIWVVKPNADGSIALKRVKVPKY